MTNIQQIMIDNNIDIRDLSIATNISIIDIHNILNNELSTNKKITDKLESYLSTNYRYKKN